MEQGTVIGVLAHVDAGKTTLSEQILYRRGVLRSLGRVDQQNAFLDDNPLERQRGITIFTGQACFTAGDRSFYLLDTPGHVDFSGEMERCLSVLDCAVLVISAVEGVQAHTETLWRLLEEKAVPTLLFVNKTDREGAGLSRVLGELNRLGGAGFVPFPEKFEDGLPVDAQEALSELDDDLLETYLETGALPKDWVPAAGKLLAKRRLFPVFSGSALRGEGVDPLLRGLELLAPSAQGDANQDFSGRVYKVRHDKGGRVVFLKVEAGSLCPKTMVDTPEGPEKCNEVRVYQGEKYQAVSQAGPGTLCGVTGLSGAKAGDWIGSAPRRGLDASLRPLLSSQVLFDRDKFPAPAMLQRFRELEDEEPLLNVAWREQTQQLEVRIMGEIQLEVLTDLCRERWGVEVAFGPCSVLYRETLAKPVVGVGHFEPLRHYAEVHLRLSPGPRGSGITFQSACPLDDLSLNWQRLIETHVLEKQHLGVLTGSPLTDVEVTLLSGRAHLKHTEGGDFREAVYRAIRQGLMSGESLLLEPYYAFSVEVELSEMGRVQSDILRLEGQCGAPVESGGRLRLEGRGPVRTLMDYPKELMAFTKGRGRMAFRFDGYEPCQDQKEIVEAIGYEADRDVENTGDSVFCSHGAGYPVKWYDAPGAMHLPVETV